MRLTLKNNQRTSVWNYQQLNNPTHRNHNKWILTIHDHSIYNTRSKRTHIINTHLQVLQLALKECEIFNMQLTTNKGGTTC